MAQSKARIIGIIALTVIVVFGVIGAVAVGLWGGRDGGGFVLGGTRIGVVPIGGVIVTSRRTVKLLDRYRRDASIKAIILRINSTGGAVAPSQEIYHAVKRAAAKKPVVASFGSVAASGGYYVASPATRIVANPSSLTGSIGVILMVTNYFEALKNLGVKINIFTSGKFKALGSPFIEKMKPEEKKKLEAILVSVHRQFRRDVLAGRRATLMAARPKWAKKNWTAAYVKTLATGEVFTGEQARAKGLVDELGGLRQAILVAKRLAKIKGRARLVYPRPEDRSLFSTLFGRLFGGVTKKLPPSGASLQSVWLPGR
ncbi:MAG: signal peptide peptidase SppA [Proteobacteria bacterium]|nr:signal peptide peptidase SppA [Pseudomonadota bacterium]MBU1742576.1 signal peptide peptidase SppA [Pseudomonadota bacterium]